MGSDPQTVYREHAPAYHELVLAEDCEGRLIPAIEALAPLEGASIPEAGAGTGRITRPLLERGARRVEAFEKEPAMVDIGREYLADIDPARYRFEVADARDMPVDDDWADLAIAGCVFGHFRYWMPDGWRRECAAALDEMDRALTHDGVGIVIETLGTGVPTSHPGDT